MVSRNDGKYACVDCRVEIVLFLKQNRNDSSVPCLETIKFWRKWSLNDNLFCVKRLGFI